MRQVVMALLLLPCCCGPSRFAQAATWYVSTTGSDQHAGSVEAPFRTIDKGLQMMASGDTLYLRQGTYFEQIDSNARAIPAGGGSWAAATTIASFPGETATLASASCCVSALVSLPPPPTQDGWIIFDRLVLDASNSRYGAAIITDHVRFQNGEVKQSGLNLPFHTPFDPGQDEAQAFALGGPFSEVLNSEIHHSPRSYGFYVTGHHNLISNNSIHDNGGFAVQIYEGNFPSKTTSNHVVSNNTMVNNGYFRHYPAITVGEGTGNLITGNAICGNFGGIWVYKHGTSTTVVNNTFAGNGYDIQMYDPNTTPVVRDNLFTSGGCPAPPVVAAAPPMLLPAPTHLRLASASGTSAGRPGLAWDYPMAAQAGTTYQLRIVTLQGGVPTAAERPIDPFTAPPCRQDDPQATPETLCGAICLGPGDSTLSLFALRNGQRSSESNVLDVDLTSMTPCMPVVVAPPKPLSPPKDTGKTIAGGLVVGGVAAALLAAQSAVPGIPGLMNLGCISWHLEGPCVCGFPPHPCTTVSYMQPTYIVEVTPRPGDTTIPILGTVLQAALAATGGPALGGGGAGNATGSGHTNLFYNEVHIYTYPDILGSPCSACVPTGGIALNYSSEIDAISWRTAVAVPSPLDLVLRVGIWGNLYPRSGKVIHGSGVIASALAAVRAMDIARQPIGTPPNVDAHIVTMPTTGRASCMAMAYPRQLPCMDPGGPPPLWETETTSLSGRYVYVIYERKRCCVEAAQATCGLTLIGGHGQNLCILPPMP